MKQLLEKLSNAYGVSGYEDEVREIMAKQLSKVSEVETDKFGNVIGKKGSGNPKIMLAAHMDEVGFLAKYVDENGFIKFIKMGGLDDQILPGLLVKILAEKRQIPAVIGYKPPHLMKDEESKKKVKYEDLFIDTGLSKEETAKLVQVGDPIVFDSKFIDLSKDTVLGKAFDNRVGCAVLVEVMKRLNDFPGTVYGVATTQEEIGLKGARTAAFKLDPDYSLALDTTIAGGTPDISKNETTIEMGKGPCITVVESSGRGMVPSPKVKKHLVKCAKDANIPYQLDAWKEGMTDAAIIYMTREGIPSGGICVPARYIHAPYGIVHMGDIENAIKLTIESLKHIKELG
ncbi:MAG: M42 family metallopeptidase [Candidatus Altiarchaeota archaeon]|nr:M42 family metallopeptidase [Candidatus Altiarchaeota archaeon]